MLKYNKTLKNSMLCINVVCSSGVIEELDSGNTKITETRHNAYTNVPFVLPENLLTLSF